MFVVKAWKKDMTTEGKEVNVKFGKSNLSRSGYMGAGYVKDYTDGNSMIPLFMLSLFSEHSLLSFLTIPLYIHSLTLQLPTTQEPSLTRSVSSLTLRPSSVDPVSSVVLSSLKTVSSRVSLLRRTLELSLGLMPTRY